MLLQVLLVSLAYVIVCPSFKGLANSCVDDVSQPLPRKQMELLFIRQVAHELGILPGLREHALDRDVLVLGAVDLSVLVRLNAYSC